jgi:hypothetical protein
MIPTLSRGPMMLLSEVFADHERVTREPELRVSRPGPLVAVGSLRVAPLFG